MLLRMSTRDSVPLINAESMEERHDKVETKGEIYIKKDGAIRLVFVAPFVNPMT